MPLLEIANANAKASFQHPLCSIRTQKRFHHKIASISLTFGNEQRVPYAWKSLGKHKKLKLNVGCVELRRGRLMIKAIAILEPNRLAASEDKCMKSKDSELGLNSNPLGAWHESSNEESKEPDEKEKLRRMRISKANKGGTSWNKGKKHSPETLQKIRERTRLAMQNPKVKMKLANLGHAQTAETRLKIGAGVKKGWEMKREKKMVQETCYFDWQNLIAEASRQGHVGQEELQWNSYKILDEQLTQEWQESINQRKNAPKVKGSRNAPKPLEQRRKIAEAISSKWANPEYRERVCSAMAKYHGTEVGAERKPRRTSDGTQSMRRNPIKKRSTDTIISLEGENKILNQMNRSKSPVYKDPLVSSKLEMIKNIRAQRAAAETKTTEAIEQARSLIAEAEKAAKVLEVAATKSPIALASLIETRKLIAEAIQSLESINTQQITESNDSSMASSEIDEEKGAAFEVPNRSDIGQVNGHKTLLANDYKFSDDSCGVSSQNLLNGDLTKLHLTTPNGCTSSPLGFDCRTSESSSTNEPTEALQDQGIKHKVDFSPTVGEQPLEDDRPSRSRTVTKKWVRGRLVEVEEETQ